jgi:type VII secretion protein EccE
MEMRVPRPTKAQLVLVELAAAAVLGGRALDTGWLTGAWSIAGAAIGVVLLLLAIVPVSGRWLYQLIRSTVGMRGRRRRAARGPGLVGLFGDYEIESVPAAGRRGRTLGVVRSGTTWSLPLVLTLDAVFNDDAAVPVELLADLLHVEDVPFSSVRLFTLVAPAQTPPNAPAGPVPPLVPLAARYCLITLDTRRAADAIAARGGTSAAVHQILRRCAVHAEQVLATAGVTVRRLDENAVASLFATWLGPVSDDRSRDGEHAVESLRDVLVDGTWSTMFAVSGDGEDLADRVTRLAAAAPTPVAATALVLTPTGHGGDTGGGNGGGNGARGVEATMLLRLSAPAGAAREGAAESLRLLAQAYGLRMQRISGEQGSMLRATTPLGVGEPV